MNSYIDYEVSGSQVNELGQVIKVPDTFAQTFTVFGVSPSGDWVPLHNVDSREEAENVKLGFKDELARKQALSIRRPQLNIGIILNGGLVTDVVCDRIEESQNIRVFTLDYDTEGVDDEEIKIIQFKNGNHEEAVVFEHLIDQSGFDLNQIMTSKETETEPEEQYLISYGREPKVFDRAGLIKLADDLVPFKITGLTNALMVIKSAQPGIQIHPIGKAL